MSFDKNNQIDIEKVQLMHRGGRSRQKSRKINAKEHRSRDRMVVPAWLALVVVVEPTEKVVGLRSMIMSTVYL